MTELSATTASTRRKLGRIHGVKPKVKSKFWVYDDDEDSESDSEKEDISTPTLRQEAEAAGFTAEQLRQAEDELQTLESSQS
jgi:hypothetical protein